MAEEEQIGFLSRLRWLALSDDVARWRVIATTIIVAGAFGSFDVAILSHPLDEAIPQLGILALLISFGGIVWYCSIKPIYRTDVHSPSRRILIYQAAASCVALIAGVALRRHESKRLDSQISKATESDNYVQVADLLDRARTANFRLDPATAKRTARKSAQAAANRPEAWNAVLASLNYKSFLDSASIPTDQWIGHDVVTHYSWWKVGGGPPPTFKVYGVAPFAEAARFEVFGAKSESGPEGNRFLLVDGGWLSIDKTTMRHVVFRNVDIVYEGDPLEMEDVYFLNCTFHLPLRPSTERFAFAILDAGPSVGRFEVG
jgi:hypothetical protein